MGIRLCVRKRILFFGIFIFLRDPPIKGVIEKANRSGELLGSDYVSVKRFLFCKFAGWSVNRDIFAVNFHWLHIVTLGGNFIFRCFREEYDCFTAWGFYRITPPPRVAKTRVGIKPSRPEKSLNRESERYVKIWRPI